MNYLRKNIVFPAVALLLLIGCAKDDATIEELENPSGIGIVFEMGFAGLPDTRVVAASDFSSTWEHGDQVGIFAVKRADDSDTMSMTGSNYINNAKLTYNSADGGSWSGDSVIYWPQDGSVLDFYAYYPYDSLATNPRAIAFKVKLDQGGMTDSKSNYNLSHLLTAKSTASKRETVRLTFSHALAMVQIEVPENIIGPAVVRLRRVSVEAVLDLDGEAGPEAAPSTIAIADIAMYRISNNYFRALVPAQTLAKDAVFYRIFAGDEIYDGSLTVATDLTAGEINLFKQEFPIP